MVAINANALSYGGPDITDMWWNANESGWGMNIVQQGSTSFVTRPDAYSPLQKWKRRPSGRRWMLPDGGIGGVEGDRTLDLRIANAALSQLSYHPSRRARL